MPQMMPLNWLTSMLYFTMIFYLFNNLIYFNFIKEKKNQTTQTLKLKYNWKW
uniref:ATP synthase complex subunit 8 n=1 Tax=Gastrolina thoracica TaxID=2041218 RepID=A0A343KIE4_9CUCU|nr:ATP synthase F0 subunit 8 [Gastrolina thoracica]ATG33622.1 ATP synthase F0 subunit 8 [Gastrolina thoracica]